MRGLNKLLPLLLAFLLPACPGTDTPDGGPDAGADAGTTETCEARLAWLQKDAYKASAGRGADFWPPHTTMTLEVNCTPTGGAAVTVATTSMNNHGTAPTDVDVTGAIVLEEMRSETHSGTRADLLALVAAFEACECGTNFLSLDALGDVTVAQLVGELSTYLGANLTCTGAGGTQAVVDALVASEIETLLALGIDCTFSGGRSWEAGFNDALAAVIVTGAETLADYHVCNNDASLQASLWQNYVTSGTTVTCDPESTLCAGPLWFYVP